MRKSEGWRVDRRMWAYDRRREIKSSPPQEFVECEGGDGEGGGG